MLTFARWVLTILSGLVIWYGINMAVDAGDTLIHLTILTMGPYIALGSGVALSIFGLYFVYLAWGSAKDKSPNNEDQ